MLGQTGNVTITRAGHSCFTNQAAFYIHSQIKKRGQSVSYAPATSTLDHNWSRFTWRQKMLGRAAVCATDAHVETHKHRQEVFLFDRQAL